MIAEQQKQSILSLIARLSPNTEVFVRAAMEKSGITIFLHDENPITSGVFCLVRWEGTNYAYASFMQDMVDDQVIRLIESTIRPYIEDNDPLCFNVYGGNKSIIELVKKLGFTPDMEGYEFVYQGQVPLEFVPTKLTIKAFEQSALEDFVTLFEQSYYQLNKDNGWSVDWYANNKGIFSERLALKSQTDELVSFWSGDRLVGTYIISGKYIQDLVVHPEYQGLGYGKTLLLHALNLLIEQKGHQSVYLRVAKSNAAAIRFYLRNHFVEIASFAEHTFHKN
ncbi:hypothetical protein Back11_60190 [Paenibacillus baekrokdamisoli]|uniref:Uncharacterized protein n=1 Tax=Paenibacillus baekrokdamisoli TaxID=1712516 RepID=A0A3G9JP93_9BACL|nr:GNAT family N-acetyltransferase [Paenibacillus baekrokdamisoli]MBB3071290.1 GNAT superfamily N-acetyltransferase [Paenibacillus baekrokdamisoli]BBH24674.1 hypothetical protein Back11_60190 [Paenibacillus baekrokdamisoli]